MHERKKKIIKALSLLLVVLFITVGYALITTDRVNVKGTNNKISIYVQDGSSYTLATFNTIPKRGYKLNTTRTVCDDVNTVVTWDNSTRTISLTTSKNPKCSVYLDDLVEAGITTYSAPTGKNNVQDAIDELFEKLNEYEGE